MSAVAARRPSQRVHVLESGIKTPRVAAVWRGEEKWENGSESEWWIGEDSC